MQNSLVATCLTPFGEFCNNARIFLCGAISTMFGYFLPVKDIVHLLIILFLLDVAFGYWAARKLRGERFKVSIIWTKTIPRMLISIVLILAAYGWDHVYSQDFVSTYKLIGWFISGVLIYSIAQNGWHITKWNIFPKLMRMIDNFIKDKTGESIKDNENE